MLIKSANPEDIRQQQHIQLKKDNVEECLKRPYKRSNERDNTGKNERKNRVCVQLIKLLKQLYNNSNAC